MGTMRLLGELHVYQKKERIEFIERLTLIQRNVYVTVFMLIDS